MRQAQKIPDICFLHLRLINHVAQLLPFGSGHMISYNTVASVEHWAPLFFCICCCCWYKEITTLSKLWIDIQVYLTKQFFTFFEKLVLSSCIAILLHCPCLTSLRYIFTSMFLSIVFFFLIFWLLPSVIITHLLRWVTLHVMIAGFLATWTSQFSTEEEDLTMSIPDSSKLPAEIKIWHGKSMKWFLLRLG